MEFKVEYLENLKHHIYVANININKKYKVPNIAHNGNLTIFKIKYLKNYQILVYTTYKGFFFLLFSALFSGKNIFDSPKAPNVPKNIQKYISDVKFPVLSMLPAELV